MKLNLNLVLFAVVTFSAVLHVSAQNTFPASGNVGINMASGTTPGANLVVNGKARILSQLMVGADYDAPGFYQLYLQGPSGCEQGFRDASQGTDQKVWAVVVQGGRYRIMTVNDGENAIQEAFTINRTGMNVTNAIFPNGNLLVGKSTQTNTGYKLDVNGTGRLNKVVVNTTGADFVFDSTYRLPSLTGLENYIHANHHLPGIEPAAQMQEKGLDVGDNQTKLLQKVEELTLYTIEQEKQLALQKKQLELMQAQIEELKAVIKK